MENDNLFIRPNGFEINPPQNPYARISEVAAKLGVPPHKSDGPATVLMPGGDGQMYDLFEVVIRFLDRLDSANAN